MHEIVLIEMYNYFSQELQSIKPDSSMADEDDINDDEFPMTLPTSIAVETYLNYLSDIASSRRSKKKCKCWQCVHVHLKSFPPYFDYGPTCNIGATFGAFIMVYHEMWTQQKTVGVTINSKSLNEWIANHSEPKTSAIGKSKTLHLLPFKYPYTSKQLQAICHHP